MLLSIDPVYMRLVYGTQKRLACHTTVYPSSTSQTTTLRCAVPCSSPLFASPLASSAIVISTARPSQSCNNVLLV